MYASVLRSSSYVSAVNLFMKISSNVTARVAMTGKLIMRTVRRARHGSELMKQ